MGLTRKTKQKPGYYNLGTPCEPERLDDEIKVIIEDCVILTGTFLLSKDAPVIIQRNQFCRLGNIGFFERAQMAWKILFGKRTRIKQRDE